jgi:hypothetical protein
MFHFDTKVGFRKQIPKPKNLPNFPRHPPPPRPLLRTMMMMQLTAAPRPFYRMYPPASVDLWLKRFIPSVNRVDGYNAALRRLQAAVGRRPVYHSRLSSLPHRLLHLLQVPQSNIGVFCHCWRSIRVC